MKKYFSLVKFSHTVFALPFACVGFTLGVQEAGFSWLPLLFMLMCMVFARNAAMGFNRYADRRIDARNPRTAGRELPRGVISSRNALAFVIINALAFMATAYMLNLLCLYLSPVALCIVLGYSITKRFTWLCHLVLGLGLSVAPIGAYIAVTGAFAAAPLLLSALVLFWTAGFDVLYALPDEEFDQQEKLHSIPQAFGRVGAMRLSLVLHLCAAFFVVLAGIVLPFGYTYWVGAGIFISLLVYQHLIVKPTDLSRLNAAFFTTNGIASVVFAIFAIISIIFK